jgi:hypothetical protein
VRRPQKITLGEMRARHSRLLIYCSDYKCSHNVEISADQRPDDVRLSDLEPLFTCQACGIKGAEVRADFIWKAKNKETPPANWRALIYRQSTRHLKGGPSWLRWRVAGSAEKAAAIPCLNDLKAVWNVVHVKFPRASVCCRKLGFAHLSAIRTSKNFNPTIAGHPIYGHALLFRSKPGAGAGGGHGTFLPLPSESIGSNGGVVP